ncbi:MAG: hypothetical protein ACXW3X_04360 [Rhodoplanes sp.]
MSARFAGGEIKRRLRQIDAVIVADFGSRQRGLHHAGVAAGDVEEAEGRREDVVQSFSENAADLALGQIVAFDELAVRGPLLLELRKRRGVHHRAGGLELMDVNVDQTGPPTKTWPHFFPAAASVARMERRRNLESARR